MRVLILALPIGAGHMTAARAVEQAIRHHDPQAQVRIEDCFRWVWPVYGYCYQNIYEFLQKRSRALLRLFYRRGVGAEHGDSSILYAFHRATVNLLPRLMASYRPDYVLCTHFSPGYYAAVLKSRFGYRLGIVVTDYFVHPQWVNREIDQYFLPDDSLIQQTVAHGAKAERMHPCGIPVGLMFEQGVDKEAARKRFGLDPRRVSAVVMGSRVFGGEWFEIVREIVDYDYDLIVLCGENQKAMRRIKALRGKARLVVLGMVERMEELMNVCDILITKAGGLTSTEAAHAAPCLLFANSIPGLEDKNEEFFVQHQAALRIDKHSARATVGRMLAEPATRNAMKKNLQSLARRNSAQNIARVIAASCHGA